VADVESLYAGLAECARAHGGVLAGGNLSGGVAAVLTSTCLGEVSPDLALRRTGARPGWRLAMTGRAGGAAAALRERHRLDSGAGTTPDPDAVADPAVVAAWNTRLRRPQPRLREAALIAAQGIRVCLDVSDGLFLDAGRLLRHGVGVVIDPERLSLDTGIREAFANSWIEVAGGGEDYELLFAGPPERIDAACGQIVDGGGEATVIGEFDTGPGVRLRGAGGTIPAPPLGHEHFRAARG
jgi:thiamine-monophosphate kinase